MVSGHFHVIAHLYNTNVTALQCVQIIASINLCMFDGKSAL